MAYDKVVDSAFLEAGLTLVGDSIRAKGGTSAKLEFPNGMKAAVDAIDTSKPEQTKTVTPSLSQQTINPDSGYTLSSVTVAAIPSDYIIPSGSVNITENGTHNVSQYASAVVNVSGSSSEDLSAELAEYTALNAELEEVIDSLPDAGSSGGTGGGSLETCTITINGVGATMLSTICDSGNSTGQLDSYNGSTQTQTITVVCGTIVAVYFFCDFGYNYTTFSWDTPKWTVSSFGSFQFGFVAPSAPGNYTVTITGFTPEE